MISSSGMDMAAAHLLPPWIACLRIGSQLPTGPARNGGEVRLRRVRGTRQQDGTCGERKGGIRRRCASPLLTTTAPEPDGKLTSRGEMVLEMVPVSGGSRSDLEVYMKIIGGLFVNI